MKKKIAATFKVPKPKGSAKKEKKEERFEQEKQNECANLVCFERYCLGLRKQAHEERFGEKCQNAARGEKFRFGEKQQEERFLENAKTQHWVRGVSRARA